MIRTLFAIILLCATGSAGLRADPKAVVTAAQVNGTWETERGEFKILAIGRQMLQVEFSGTYGYNSPQGPMANTGEGRGVASIEGDTAIFKPDGAEEECKITMKFARGKLNVTQTGVCGFGNRVTAEGTYKRTSTAKPKFNSGEGD